MWKILSFIFPLILFSQELEVRLSTRHALPQLYLSSIYTDPAEHDWRYFEDLRSILEFDLNASGYCLIAQKQDLLEKTLHFPDVRAQFDLPLWQKQKIPFLLAIQVAQNRIHLTAFNIEKGTSKKYTDVLTGLIEKDRRSIHKLADLIQKDLFGSEGIASLKLIYTQRAKNPLGKGWYSEIWLSDADGANARQLTTEKSYCLSPFFLPSGKEFLYVSEKNGQSKIYRSSLEDPFGELFIELRGNQTLPALTQKGMQIAFITDVAGRPDLFMQQMDSKGKAAGKARQLYSCPRATQASPTFSPDGKKVAFVSDKDGPPRVYVMDIKNAKDTQRPRPQLLTTKNRENTSPSWSPDGKKLAYSAKIEGVRQIWVYFFDTQEEIQLTTGPETKENPSWAPDSFHLVYNTESDEICELYLAHLNGGEPIKIGEGRFASWEPR